MSAGGVRRWAVLLVALVAAPAIRADAAPVAELREQVRRRPGDVDARLRLSLALARAGERARARAHARVVVRRAPRYWDAHLLLARLDGWDGRHDRAMARLRRVIARAPGLRAARLLLADVAIWAERPDIARPIVARLVKARPSADLHYRMAQIAHQEGRSIGAYEAAGRALALAPNHERARELRDSIAWAAVDIASGLEVFPISDRSKAVAVAETVNVRMLPGARVSAQIGYEYRRRFDTDNHRGSLRLDWRPLARLALTGFVRAGKAEVVPVLTAIAEARWRASPDRGLGARYWLDVMPWSGVLHRAELRGDTAVADEVAVGGAAAAGLLRHCGVAEPVYGGRLWTSWTPAPLALELRYHVGAQVERVPLSPALEDRLGDDGCPDAPGDPGVQLVDIASHGVTGQISYYLDDRTILRSGYGLDFRLTGGRVHRSYLALRRTF